LSSLVAVERFEMLATSLQRMQLGLRSSFFERNFVQNVSVSAIARPGRSQKVYEQMIHQLCSILEHSDNDASDAAQKLLQAHNRSMLVLQAHVAYYLEELQKNVVTTADRNAKSPRRHRPQAAAITNALSVRIPHHPPPASFNEQLGYSPEEMPSTELFVPNDVCLRAVEQQARMATTLAAHFSQSEADAATAFQILHERQQKLKVFSNLGK
jgi:hypothetical protein